MGCRQSNSYNIGNEPQNVKNITIEEHNSSETQAMASWVPLDAKQVFKLKKSWKGIKRNITETGVEMFVR